MGARCIPARTSPLPSHTPQQHVRHDHVRRPRGRQGFRDLQVRPRNEARRVRRAGFDPAPRLRVLHPPSRASSDDADIPASVARRRVAGACRPGADRIPLLRSSRIRRSARKVQSSKSRGAQRPLSSFPASARSLATAPKRDFGDRWRGGLSGGPRGGHRATRRMNTLTRSQINDASCEGCHRPRPRSDPRVVPFRPSFDRSAFPRHRKPTAFSVSSRTRKDAFDARRD